MPMNTGRSAPPTLQSAASRLIATGGMPPSLYPEPFRTVLQRLTPFFPGFWTKNTYWDGINDQVQALYGWAVWPPVGPSIPMGVAVHQLGPSAVSGNHPASLISAQFPQQSTKHQKSSYDPTIDLYNQLVARWPLISAGYEDEFGLFTVGAAFGYSPVYWGFGYTLVHSTQWPVRYDYNAFIYLGVDAFW